MDKSLQILTTLIVYIILRAALTIISTDTALMSSIYYIVEHMLHVALLLFILNELKNSIQILVTYGVIAYKGLLIGFNIALAFVEECRYKDICVYYDYGLVSVGFLWAILTLCVVIKKFFR